MVDRIKNPAFESAVHALSGASAGMFSTALLFPLDTLKTRTAIQSGHIYRWNDMLSDLLRGRNYRDIYRGLSVGLLEACLFHGVFFFFHTLLKNEWKRNHAPSPTADMPPLTSLLRGSIAGIFTQLVTTPIKVVQIRVQSSEEDVRTRDIIKDIYQTEGIWAFWRGMDANVILVVNPSIVFFIYDRLKHYLQKVFGKNSALAFFFAGGLSKAVATVICFPLVFIKMNMQAGNSSPKLSRIPLSTRDKSKNGPSISRKQTPFYADRHSAEKGFFKPLNTNDSDSNDDDTDTYTMDEPMPVTITPTPYSDEPERQSGIPYERQFAEDHDDLDHMRDRAKQLLPERGVTSSDSDSDSSYLQPLKRGSGRQRGNARASMSMSQMFANTVRDRGFFGLYEGLGPKVIHSALTYAFIFASKEQFTRHTFVILLYLVRFFQQRKTKIATAIPTTVA